MKLLSLARDLKRRKARERLGLFIAEGTRTVEALLGSRVPVRGALVSRSAANEPRISRILAQLADRRIPVDLVSDAEFESAADTESPQGVLVIGEVPLTISEGLADRALVLVLDAIQDPGNVGTILRSAAALGVSVTISLPGTVDLWNAKVVRSSMGALFTHQVLPFSWEEAAQWLSQRSIPLWAADAEGEALHVVASSRPERLALVVSNEGAGVSPHVAQAASRRVCIPMTQGSESLNVAVAAGILMYVLGQGPT